MPPRQPGHVKIGDVAAELGIPASTIRYYERKGLLGPPPRVSGRRVFDRSALETLRFVRLAKAAGFSLQEIKDLQDAYDAGSKPDEMWRPLAEKKRAALRAQILELEAMDNVLTELLRCRCATVAECVSRAARRGG